MDEVDALWGTYVEDRSLDNRNALVLYYTYLVEIEARSLSTTLKINVDFEDLVIYGTFGLIDAVERFDLSRGYAFRTFAIKRVRGAMVDEYRKVSWMPRTILEKIRTRDKAVSDLRDAKGDLPSRDELAESLGVDVKEFRKTERYISYSKVVSTNKIISYSSDDGSDIELGSLIRSDAPDPSDVCAEDSIVKILSETIGRLSGDESTVLSLYFYEEMSLAAIGDVLGVTESRVSQIKRRALERLEELLRGTDIT